MIDQEQIINQLHEWMKGFVEVPNPALGDFPPCPYARQARINNKIEIVFTDPIDFMSCVKQSLNTLETKDVVVVCFNHNLIDPVSLQEWVGQANDYFMPQDYVILEDHPDSPEYVSGVNMNFGKCGLLVIQRLSKLNDASDQLRSKGYYTHWNKEALDEVVTWRYE
jgi:hypothetical protein